jgi:hypothetical protein
VHEIHISSSVMAENDTMHMMDLKQEKHFMAPPSTTQTCDKDLVWSHLLTKPKNYSAYDAE